MAREYPAYPDEWNPEYWPGKRVLGLELPASTTVDAPSERRIVWVRQPGGGLVASIYGQGLNPNEGTLRARAISPDQNKFAGLNLRALNAAQRVFVEAGAAGTELSRLVLDDAGNSNFVQNLSQESLRVIRGIYTTIGGAAVIQGGQGFNVVRTAIGTGAISFHTPFTGVPTITHSLGQGTVLGVIVPATGSITAAGVTLVAFNLAGAPFDSIIHFTATGPTT